MQKAERYGEDKMSKGDITKREIAKAFKKLMEEKAFEHITISDIMNECGLNRLTFYHHFQDKYALLNWIYYNEIISCFTEKLNVDNWVGNLKRALTVIKENQIYYENAFSQDNDEFGRYVFEVTEELFFDAIKKTQIAESNMVEEEDMAFVAKYFAYGVSGMITEWVTKGMKETPESLVNHVSRIVEHTKILEISSYLKIKDIL